jgi:hypothetical protein
VRICRTTAALVALLPAIAGSQTLTRASARALLEKSLVAGGNAWDAGADCPSALWDHFQDSRRYLSQPIVVTGIADGEAGAKLATFTIRLVSLRNWTGGSGIASFKKWDDGWRLSQANVLACVSGGPASPAPRAGDPNTPNNGGAVQIYTAPGSINFRTSAAPALRSNNAEWVAVTAAASQRCAKFAVAHPGSHRRVAAMEAPAVPLRKFKLLSFAATLDSGISAFETEQGFTYRKGQLGPFAFLETGEVCVGSVAVTAANTSVSGWEAWRAVFATPAIGPTGVRLLGVGDGGGPVWDMWVVHADSTRPLSMDVLVGLPNEVVIPHYADQSGSPDGRYLLSGAVFRGGGQGVVGVDLRAGTSRFIALYQGMPDMPGQSGCGGWWFPLDSVRWRGGVADVPARYRLNNPSDPQMVARCSQPRDNAYVTIDLQRGTATRVP